VLVFNEITKMPNPYDPIVVGQQGGRRRAMLFAGVRVMEWDYGSHGTPLCIRGSHFGSV
jgi:hypothetical protein